MTSKAEFDKARSVLQEKRERFDKDPEIWGIFDEIRTVFDTAEPWSFLNEIIQNSVDVGAKNIRMSVGDNTVELQHDGTDPLNSGAVQGLCGFALSTKGLDSVGFMGIGFKSFTGFFESVTVSDDGISFLLQAPFKGKQVDIKELYSPKWESQPLDRHTGMTTAFRFQRPKGRAISKFSEVPDSIDLMDLAVIGSGSNSLETLRIDNYEFRINNEGNNVISVTASQDSDEIKKMHFLVLDAVVSLDEEATEEMKTRRRKMVRDEDRNVKTITRTVRLLKELDAEIGGDGTLQKVKPKKMDSGKMFCLVSLGHDFPFNIGIDSDWLMNSERTKLRPEHEAGSWHRQLLSALPELIRQYFEWLPDNLSSEERATALDIFPDDLWEPTTGLEFIDDDAFKEILREKLSNCNFILCSDGKLRSPSETRDIPPKPKNMDGGEYESLNRDCFTCPILDTKAIQSKTIRDLEKLTGFLPFPEISEVNEGEIRSLWNKDNPDDYKHILDILNEITTFNEKDEQNHKTRGPKVLPAARDNSWTNILGPQIAFWSLPIQTGVERPIHVALINSHPDVKDTIEVHKSLREIKTTGWQSHSKPGYKWKKKAKESATTIMEKVRGLNLPRDNKNVLAMFCYCLRIDKPEDITFLTSTTGPIEKENCVIGPPFANEKIGLMFPNQIFSYDGPKDRVKDKVKVKDFLKRAGAIFVKPTLLSKEMTEGQTKSFLRGKSPPPGKKTDMTYEARDWTWGIPLNGCKDMEVLSRYLSKPDDKLKEAIEKSKRYLKLKYKYANRSHSPEYPSLDCSWLIELREVAWVPCADKKLRKPNDASLPPQGKTPVGKQVTLVEETIKLYTEKGIRFGPDLPDDPQEALQAWKEQPASREPKLFSKFVKKIRVEDKISRDDLVDLVGEVLWVTNGKSSAPLKRFIDLEDFDDWGGFLGRWSVIDAGIRDTLGDIGFKPNSTIDSSMAKEMVKKFSRAGLERINDHHWDYLSQANSIILAENPDEFKNGRFLRYDGNWSSDNETAYIQFIKDNHRFGDLASRIIRPEQLPKELETLENILFDSDHLKLIDNEVEVNNPVSQSSEARINIQRLMSSLDLSFEFEVKYYDKYPLSVSLEGNEMRAHYLIQYSDWGEVTLHLSGDGNRWSNQVASFLTNQIQSPSSLEGTISQCLGAAHSNQDFDDASQMLGDEGIEILPRASSADQPDSGRDSDDGTESLSRSPKQRGTLNEPLGQPDDVTKEEMERARKGTRSSKKPKDSDKREEEAVRIKGKTGKEVADERKKTGKAAESIVLRELKNEGWEPLSWNDEFKEERVGHDLVFKRGHEVRVVEVKGWKGEWQGDQDISEAQLRMGLIYHGEEPSNHPGCTYSVWLYVVENVYGEYEIHQINWPEKNISAYFPRNTWAPKPSKDDDEDD